jgi:NAD(P)-dependent dehydrogenase (short-subunit alcohol dehydrogenase family)
VGELEGKRVVVTGGASGIGAAAARRMTADGARIAILDIDAEKADTITRELGGRAWEADVRDLVAVKRAMEEASAWLGGLDVLVNNAGVGNFQLLDDHTPEIWRKVIDVNLTGAYHGMIAAVPLMRKSGGGAIVNNSSGSGVRPTRGELPYSAAKAGVIALTQGAAQEYGPTIRVNCVSPGLIRTPMSEALFKIPGILDPVLKSTPLERTGTADEVADAIAFLASDRAKFITGQNLVIDGGMGLAQAGIDDTLRKLLELMKGAKR